MQFKPRSESEINEAGLIPHKTICDFEIIKAQDTTSKNGAQMIAIKLKVFYNEGFKLVDDYLLESMPAKLRHFCEGSGLLKQYELGTLCAEDCRAICGKVKIKVEPAGDYPAKNSVQDYVVKEKAKVLAGTSAPIDKVEDSDVPF